MEKVNNGNQPFQIEILIEVTLSPSLYYYYNKIFLFCQDHMVRDERLELSHPKVMDFKSTASANSANPALVAVEGYAPSSTDYKSVALLLCYTAIINCGGASHRR